MSTLRLRTALLLPFLSTLRLAALLLFLLGTLRLAALLFFLLSTLRLAGLLFRKAQWHDHGRAAAAFLLNRCNATARSPRRGRDLRVSHTGLLFF